MRYPTSQGLVLCALLMFTACQPKEPLTAAKADLILKDYQFKHEPVYAAVPQKVWWDAKHPKDDYDEKALRTLQNLQAAGLITVAETHEGDRTMYTAKVTDKGFPVLGTGPSMRGPIYRGLIAYKKYDGIRNFQRHPTEPTTGHAELVWHYDDPTPLYPMFETRIDKPLKKPFVSLVSFYYKDHQWKFDVTVRKADLE